MTHDIVPARAVHAMDNSAVFFTFMQEQMGMMGEELQLSVSSKTIYEQEKALLYKKIEQYRTLEAGWDRLSDAKTSSTCLDMASRFVAALEPEYILPKVSAATGEEVALSWAVDNAYLCINFFEDRTLSFFYKKEKNETGYAKIRGDFICFDGHKIDTSILGIIAEISRVSHV